MQVDFVKITLLSNPMDDAGDIRPLGYESVYLPLYQVADTPFHTQKVDMLSQCSP